MSFPDTGPRTATHTSLRSNPPVALAIPDAYVVFGWRYRVQETSEGYLHDHKISSAPFNMLELTAAHKTCHFSLVQMTNMENGRHICGQGDGPGPVRR